MNLKDEPAYSKQIAIVADELGLAYSARYDLSRVAKYIECSEDDVKKLISNGDIRIARTPTSTIRVFGSEIINYLFGDVPIEKIEELRHPAKSRLLKIGDVVRLTSLSRSTIDMREREGDFPARVKLSTRRVAWHESEVLLWMSQRAKNTGN